MPDNEQVRGVIAIPGSEIDADVLLWLGYHGYRYEASGVSGRILFVPDSAPKGLPKPPKSSKLEEETRRTSDA